jgi:hypothetical protein
VKHFLNKEMLAPNAMTAGIDLAIARGLMPLLEEADRLSVTSPSWKSDVQWLTPRTETDFALFESVFDRLGVGNHVKPYLDLSEGVRLYGAHFVSRRRCSEADFHLDWVDANNEAFTLLTPLTDNAAGFGLLYKRLDGTVGDYDYKLGEALILGDNFVHSTKPGISDAPVVLLSFTFGTDRMEHWPKISQTAARQGGLVRRPDGVFEQHSASAY